MMQTATTRTRSVLTSFLMGTLLTSSVSPSLYAMDGNPGRQKMVDLGNRSMWDSRSISDIVISDVAPKRLPHKGKPKRDDGDTTSASDIGFDSVSTVSATSQEVVKPLEKIKEFKPLFRRWFLELTPDVCNESFLRYTEMYEQSFECYNKGIFVKGWKSLDDMTVLSEILHSFNAVTKVKIDIKWGDEEGDLSELILRTIPHYEDIAELHLPGCRLTHDHIEELLESIQRPEKLKILNLENNVFTHETEPFIRSRLEGLVELRMGTVSASPPMANETLKAQQEEVLRVERERQQLALERDALVKQQQTMEQQQQEMEERQRKVLAEQQQVDALKRQEEERRQQLAREQDALTSRQREMEQQRQALEQQQKAALEADGKRKTLEQQHAEESQKLKSEKERYAAQQRRLAEEKEALDRQQRANEAEQKRLTEQRQALEAAQKQPALDAKSDVPPPPPASLLPSVPPSVSSSSQLSRPSPAAAAPAVAAVLVAPSRLIPPIAGGHEDVYRRFMNGRLVYKGPSGERTFAISDTLNGSLEGEFDLRGLMYTSGKTTDAIDKYLRIKVGYRKMKENESKTTVWLVPRFMIDQSRSSFKGVSWSSDIGIFWTWGGWDVTDFDYLTSMQFDEISSKNLYELAERGRRGPGRGARGWGVGVAPTDGGTRRTTPAIFPLFLIKF